jgi:hypothetical protein
VWNKQVNKMAPKIDEITTDKRVSSQDKLVKEANNEKDEDKLEIVWKNVAIFIFLHAASLYGVYRCFFCKNETLIFCNYK